MMRTRLFAAVATAGLAMTLPVAARQDAAPADAAYRRDIDAWHEAQQAAVTAPDGALSAVALAWLHEGANVAGSAPDSDVALPGGRAPGKVGTFTLENGRVRFEAAGDAVRVNGKAPGGAHVMAPGDTVTAGDVALSIARTRDVERGPRVGIQVHDAGAPARAAFAGLAWWPVREDLRIEGTFEPYVPEKHVTVINQLSDTAEVIMVGRITFAIGTRKLRVDASRAATDPGALFITFRDRTSGNGSYDPGRYLTVPFPGGRQALDALARAAEAGTPGTPVSVTLDFNKAYNPACAFTPYAVCPLPPKQNWLPASIEAGARH